MTAYLYYIYRHWAYCEGGSKIQGGLYSTLTNQEKASVKIFLKPAREEVKEDEPEPEVSYAESVLRGAELQKRRRTSAPSTDQLVTCNLQPTLSSEQTAKPS